MSDINDIIARVRDRLDGWDPERMSFMVDDIRALLDKIERQAVEIIGTRADAWSERTARIAAEAEIERLKAGNDDLFFRHQHQTEKWLEAEAELARLRKLVDEENIEWMKPETIDRLQDAEAEVARMREHIAKQAQDIMTLSGELARLRAPVTDREIDKGVVVEKTVTLGETHYKKLLAAEAENERLNERDEECSHAWAMYEEAKAELARQAAALTAAVHEVSATGRALGEEQGRHDATKASLREAVEVMRNVRASYLQNDDHTAWCRAIPVLDDFIAKMENPERDNSSSEAHGTAGNIPLGIMGKPHE